MTTNHHTAIATGAAANASVFNAPLGTLDTAITANDTSITGLVSTLQTVLNSIILGGAAVTLTNGAANAAQKVVTVDSSAQFVAGCYVEYSLVGGVVQRNTVDTVDSSTQITLITNIGTGGIADNSPVAVLPIGFYNSQAGVFNVKNYGASPGATGAANSAAIQAAIDAAEAFNGGKVIIPDTGTYQLDTGLTVTKQIALEGIGASTILAGTNATMDVLTFNSGSDYSTVRDLWFGSTVDKTGGSGILIGGDAQVAGININNVKCIDCYVGIEINRALIYVIENCTFNTSLGKTAAAHISISNVGNPDGSDSNIVNCVFDGTGTVPAHILYTSGGGLKMSGCKFLGNGAAKCVAVDYDSGAGEIGSGLFLVTGNSFEGMTTAGIELDIANELYGFGSVAITGNEFGGAALDMIHIISKGISNVVITGNVFINTSATATDGIDIDKVTGCNITGNNFYNFVHADSVAINVANSNDVAGLVIGSNLYYSCATPIVDAGRVSLGLIASKAPANAGSTGTAGEITWDAGYIYVCTATNTWERVAIATWP